MTADDGSSPVALSGDTALVGAYGDDDNGSNSGSAYVFVRRGGTWSQQQKLTASDGAADDKFGINVVLSGNTVLVGNVRGWAFSGESTNGTVQINLDDDNNGRDAASAYVFVRSGGTWSQQLTPSDGRAGDTFGFSMALSGDTALVGAMGDDDNGSNSGSVYVFSQAKSTAVLSLTFSGLNQDTFMLTNVNNS